MSPGAIRFIPLIPISAKGTEIVLTNEIIKRRNKYHIG